ncbi:MAG: HAMP domain-containing sensor histidine kinase [Candidatus Polarisedimenticolia bacterium]
MIRRRLLLRIVVLAALAAVLLESAGRLIFDREALADETQQLLGETAHLALDLEPAWPSGKGAADAWADAAGQALRVRVSLLDAEGRVLGDSQAAPGDLPVLEPPEDHPEIVQASTRGSGVAHRPSPLSNREIQHVARRVGSAQAPLGFVRASAGIDELTAPARRQRLMLTLIALAAFGLLAGTLDLSARRLERSLRAITHRSDEVAEGRIDASLELDPEGVLGELSSSVERMRRSLAGRIRRAESEQRLLAAILGGLREGILVVNAEQRVLLINSTLRRTLRLPAEVPEGTPLMHLIWDREVIDAFDDAFARSDEVRRRVTMPDGVAFELTVVPFDDASGQGPGAIGLFFNVTQLEALERVRRDFVADISHELRTPLASVKASVETLLGGALHDPDGAERFMGIAAKNAARMEAILNDLTDLSLIETGAIQLTLAPVDLAGAVREATAAISTRAAGRNVTVRSDIPSGLTVMGDRRRLDQILVNLFDNAVKFNKPGGSVRVSGARSGSTVRLEVEDTGPGIPPGALERIFNRFYRLDRARSQEVPGTGLGLAIVKHLVRLHGGEIRAENLPQTGARFIVELPAEPAPRSPR